jgi:hypothetical protein
MNDLLTGAPNLQRTELAERIKANVRDRVHGLVSNFQVEIQDQGMVLQGRTHSYYAKQLVQHAALQAAGMPLLANRVEVL